MSIEFQKTKVSYVGKSIAPFEYYFSFKVFKESELKVIVENKTNKTTQTLEFGSDYSVDLESNEGGVVTLNAPYSTDFNIILLRETLKTQELEIDNWGPLSASQLENSLDKLTAISQEQAEKISRAILLPETAELKDVGMPLPENRKYIRWSGTKYGKLENADLEPDWNKILYKPSLVNSVAGRTGTVTLNKNDIGLNNVDNTSDVNKPVSEAAQALIDSLNSKIDNLELVDLKNVDPSGFTQVAVVTYNPATGMFEAGAVGEGGAVSSVNGKIGMVVLTKSDIGLSNIDNTSDIDKPLSTAQQSALNLKANLDYVDGHLNSKADKSSLANVATSGSYNDLTNKPVITSSISGATDVDITGIQDGQTLGWNETSQKFKPKDNSGSNLEISSSIIGTGDGVTTTFALNKTISSKNHIIVYEGKNKVYSTEFTISGQNIVFNNAPISDAKIYIEFLEVVPNNIGIPSDDTVSTAKIKNGAITPEKISSNVKIKYATKYLTANITSDITDISDLKFTGLVVGRKYIVELTAFLKSQQGSFAVLCSNGGADVVQAYSFMSVSSQNIAVNSLVKSKPFVATATSLITRTTNYSSGDQLYGNNTDGQTKVTLYDVTSMYEEDTSLI